MSDPARCVFDTNTLISAALFEHSTPGQALRCALQSGEILVSSATFAELAEVLQREKFDRYLSHAEREEFLDAFIERVTLLEPLEEIRACRDPKDDKFLELAISGKAAYLITGDHDLRSLHPFRGITIGTAAEYLAASRDKI